MIENILTAGWDAPDNIIAFTTTRKSGVSKHPYNSMNLGLHVGDDENDVIENRKILQSIIGKDKKTLWLNQIHSDIIIDSTQYVDNIDADGCYTITNNIACVVMTADCLPILITNKQGNQVAAIHCGWKGIYNELISNTVNKFNCKKQDLIIWFAPAISQQNYEVDSCFYDKFISKNKENKSAFINNRENHYLADLYKLAKIELNRLGIYNIFGGDLCTYSDERFFSFREHSKTGRIASVIYMK